MAKEDKLEEMLIRLRDVKRVLIGRHIPKEQATKLTASELHQLTEDTFNSLLPLYNIIVGK